MRRASPMKLHVFLIAALLLGALASGAVGDERLPKPLANGSRLNHSLCEKIVNGPHAGKARSIICGLAGRPAVLVYAREISPALVTLLARLEAVARRGADQKMMNSCVLLTSAEADEEALQTLGTREKLKATVLAVAPLQW